MPTISVDKAGLFKALGQDYTTEEFDELCFDFGIELDEDTSTSQRPIVNGKEEPPQLKIEIPANRYDMLCFEGISLMLNIFRGKKTSPDYRLVAPPQGELEVLNIDEETARIRPYAAGAVLRNIKFTKESYDSFIGLQDKLHQNLARQRSLVAIGTHDLDTVQGPFSYEALPPEKIEFVPLNQTRSMTAVEMMKFFDNDRHLSRYLPIIRDSPVYPVIYDSKRIVCSIPPIINGNHSKITLNTRNVFVDMTATDRTKLDICLNILVSMFSQYTEEPFTVEPVKVVSPHNHQSRETPDLTPRETQAEVSYINDCCGLSLTPTDICSLLKRMSYTASPSRASPDLIDVQVPPTRADVLHQADIMEDVAIAYGFNRLPRSFPSKSGTIAQPLMINKLSDIVRLEAAMASWSEVMPLILCSHDENFAYLNRKDDGNTAVRLANPKTAEYQVVRTSLLPGLLKTIRENKHHSVPIKIFEVSDVAFKDLSLERKSRNERHFAAAWYGKSSGFEVVHGLMDRVMLMLKSAFVTGEEGLTKKGAEEAAYWIAEVDDSTYFPGHAAAIHLRIAGKEQVIGVFGILHPTVLEKFELRYPVSTLEMNIEVFLLEQQAEASPSPPPTRRRASPSVSEASSGNEAYDDGATINGGTQGAGSSHEQMVKKLVRLALASEYSRQPIRRTDITAKVLAPNTGRQFKPIFELANHQLRSIFGCEMTELPQKEKVTVSQKRAAQRTQNSLSSSSKSYILTSTIPAPLRTPAILGPPAVPTSASESAYVGLYTFVLSLIYLSPGQSIPESRLEKQLKRVNADNYVLSGEKTETVIKRMEKQGYIVRIRERDGGGEETVDFVVGPRGKAEVAENGVAGLVRKVWGKTGAEKEELERRLVRSLGSGVEMKKRIDDRDGEEERQTRGSGEEESESEEDREEESREAGRRRPAKSTTRTPLRQSGGKRGRRALIEEEADGDEDEAGEDEEEEEEEEEEEGESGDE
ncbi:MAG: hypothetical protein LQ346_001477 [Caloplaca aetnensis]|nr:MAG: hypothetical protein LQ346_001477 [Caloplaca aetnensis]